MCLCSNPCNIQGARVSVHTDADEEACVARLPAEDMYSSLSDHSVHGANTV